MRILAPGRSAVAGLLPVNGGSKVSVMHGLAVASGARWGHAAKRCGIAPIPRRDAINPDAEVICTINALEYQERLPLEKGARQIQLSSLLAHR